MTAPVTLRLDGKMRKRLARIARRKRQSTSQIIREAIEAWVERQEVVSSPYEIVADLIGSVHGGHPERSTDTGRRFMRILKDRRSGS
jgi:predicted DNA-binding protein